MRLRSRLRRWWRRSRSDTAQVFVPFFSLHEHFDRRAAPPSILYFGDSVVERVSRDDVDTRTLGEMVAERRGRKSCLAVSHSAYHPGVYLGLLRALGRMRHRPSLLIVPINLRCFSPQWDLRPAYQFAAELRALERYVADGTLPEPIAPPIESTEALAAYDQQGVSYPSSPHDRIGLFRAIVDRKAETEQDRVARLEQIFKFHYTHPLRGDHRRLVQLRELVDLATSMKIEVFTYLTPINYEAGLRYAGASFGIECEASIGTIRKSLNDRVVDWSQLVPMSGFVSPDIANEHLNERGRVTLADAIDQTAPGRG
jgi:hypothetical protein